ncbi:MAG: hypothetical protein LBH37_03250 [Oscillospiraceae bacterium]|jgi:hypothetical protein|nr:hypothetical protein [Oscillospiraceae bacterium]
MHLKNGSTKFIANKNHLNPHAKRAYKTAIIVAVTLNIAVMMLETLDSVEGFSSQVVLVIGKVINMVFLMEFVLNFCLAAPFAFPGGRGNFCLGPYIFFAQWRCRSHLRCSHCT